jgi:hypothetical protein
MAAVSLLSALLQHDQSPQLHPSAQTPPHLTNCIVHLLPCTSTSVEAHDFQTLIETLLGFAPFVNYNEPHVDLLVVHSKLQHQRSHEVL